jgi:hypothetical protein
MSKLFALLKARLGISKATVSAVESNVVAGVKTAGQALLDQYKPAANAVIDQVADRLAAQVDAKATPESMQALIHSAIAQIHAPAIVQAALEVATMSASLSAQEIAAHGKAAVYVEAMRLKAIVAGARL